MTKTNRTTVMGKPDVFSTVYENLDQELKNACLKYEASQLRRGLRVTRISIVYTPKEAPYFDIDIDEEVKIKGQKVKAAPRARICVHETSVCNGIGQLNCLMCDLTTGRCTEEDCWRCEGKEDEPVPPTLKSSKFKVVPARDDDELDELG